MANPTLTNLFTDIADAIREKSGASDSIPAVEFPDRIREISGGGGGGTGGSIGTSAKAVTNSALSNLSLSEIMLETSAEQGEV